MAKITGPGDGCDCQQGGPCVQCGGDLVLGAERGVSGLCAEQKWLPMSSTNEDKGQWTVWFHLAVQTTLGMAG